MYLFLFGPNMLLYICITQLPELNSALLHPLLTYATFLQEQQERLKDF